MGNRFLIGAAALAASLVSVPAAAQVVSTDQSAFTTANSPTAYNFSFPNPDVVLGSSYTQGPATFGATNLIGYNDGYYGSGISYLAAVDGSTLTVNTSASAIGFLFGSWNSEQTITYSVDGVTGTFDVPVKTDTAFLGFSDLSGPTTLTFSNNAELDTIGFLASAVTAVPEPSTWAMMLVGFGLIGFGRRRRQTAMRLAS
jgi:hypothetical protein